MCDILPYAVSPHTATTVSAIWTILPHRLILWSARDLLHLRLGGLRASRVALTTASIRVSSPSNCCPHRDDAGLTACEHHRSYMFRTESGICAIQACILTVTIRS